MSARAEPASTLFERLGGRWAISLRGYVVLCLGIFLALFTTETDATRSTHGAIAWFGISVCACVALGVYLLILDRWTPYARRREQAIPIWVLLLGTAGAGLVLGVAVDGVAALAGIETGQDVVRRTVGFIIIGEWIGLALILLFDGIDRSRRRRAALIERQVGIEIASLQQTMLIEELRRQAVEEVAGELVAARSDVRQRLDALSASASVAGEEETSSMLRSVASGEVRALSSRLWSTASREYPKVPWWTVLTSTLRHEPLRPLALIAVHVLGNATELTRAYGTWTGLAMLAVVSLDVAVVSVIANRLMRRLPRWHMAIFILAALLIQTYLVPMVLWRDSIVPGSGSTAWALTQLFAGLAVIVITSAFGSWRTVIRTLERDYEQQLEQEQVEAIARSRAVAELARELSRELHGTVQSRLVACAMVSERAVESGDAEQLKMSLLEAQRVLTTSLATFESTREVATIGDEVRRKASLWDELCAVEVRIDPSIDAVEGSSALVGRVVEEALANAVRHGGAGTIAVAVTRIDDDVRIVVEDDGIGPQGEGGPGLGTTILDQATRGRWSLRPGV
ncbi:MAG: sensor histidine kinase, partial [Gaiellales bacterium]